MGASRTTRFYVLSRDLFRCRYCGRGPRQVELEVDHVYPKSRGGTDDPDNLVTACFDCNRGKQHFLLSHRARMVLEEDVDPNDDFDDRYVLAEANFSAALADAYQRGLTDARLRWDVEEGERGAVLSNLFQLAEKAERIQ